MHVIHSILLQFITSNNYKHRTSNSEWSIPDRICSWTCSNLYLCILQQGLHCSCTNKHSDLRNQYRLWSTIPILHLLCIHLHLDLPWHSHIQTRWIRILNVQRPITSKSRWPLFRPNYNMDGNRNTDLFRAIRWILSYTDLVEAKKNGVLQL